jgi:uncharacterized protein (TIGR03086 family)
LPQLALRPLRLLALVAVYAVVVFVFPRPEAVSPEGWRRTGLFLATIAGLMIQPMPGAALVIVSLTLFVLVGGVPASRALAGFSSTAVWLVFVAMLEESPMPERGTDILGDDPAQAYHRSAAALQAAAARPGVLERSQATPMGTATGAERMQWRIADLLTHGWDLVQATGVVVELPDDLAEQSLTFVRASLPSQSRTGRFADPQPVPDDAPAIERLAAFTGRPVPSKIE